MKLFTYYALHTFKNQLKKLFKTWILIFVIVCVILGGVIGLIAGTIADSIDEEPEDEYVQTEILEEEELSFSELTGVETDDMIELVAGGIILAVILFMAFGADKNGSKIFLPADVSLLFASPMKPQSILMFRLTTKLGMAVFGSAYMLFQIPNLILNVGLSIWAALAMIAVWCLTIIYGTLIQVLLYTLSSTSALVKRFLRKGIYALLALIAAGFFMVVKQNGSGYLKAAVIFFNGKASRYIPVWGWLKGLCRFVSEGNVIGTLLCLAGSILGVAVLIVIIYHIKADFYEDAMAKSEEIAELLEAVRSEKSSGVMIKRKKDRSEKLRRDGLRFGSGANIYFYKTMYNRFRFAHLGFLTKTMEFYLPVALGVAAICRFSARTTSIVPLALVLAGLAFFRALGNPLEEDTKMEYFVMIPENPLAKLLFSMVGGSANCLLDVLLPIVIGAFLIGSNLFTALLWIPFIVSVDFYATGVGAFINLSVPVSAGKTLKQVVQIMFVYFGLLPIIAIMAFGMITGHTIIAVIAASFFNFCIGFLFLGLSPFFLDRR